MAAILLHLFTRITLETITLSGCITKTRMDIQTIQQLVDERSRSDTAC